MSVRLICGHVLAELARLPADSVHCVVTSPPYYGLRNYKIEPQIWGGDPRCEHEWSDEFVRGGSAQMQGATSQRAGRSNIDSQSGQSNSQGAFCRPCGAWRGSLGVEPTLSLYLDHMTEIMRAVRRVMRKDATVFLNVGDSYCSSGNKTVGVSQRSGLHGVNGQSGIYRETLAAGTGTKRDTTKAGDGLKPKDLMMVPHRLAIRLQEDGWYVRSDIIWHKVAPMPESVTDRPTGAHEHVFLLTKSAKYFYDGEAVKEDAQSAHGSGNGYKREARLTHRDANGPRGQDAPWQDIGGKRNLRNVWTLGTETFPEAHFATFISEIPRRAILAGTSARGVCRECGAPWVRVVEKHLVPGPKAARTFVIDERNQSADDNDQGSNRQKDGHRPGWRRDDETTGWQPSCACGRATPTAVPATVLDCFVGSGTTLLVADRLQRNAIGIDLKSEYIEMARRRVFGDAPLLVEAAE